jgi:hypothetical protein
MLPPSLWNRYPVTSPGLGFCRAYADIVAEVTSLL